MKFYQSQFIENREEYSYTCNVTNTNKEAQIEFTFLDGKTQKVNTSQIEDFILENMENLKSFPQKRLGANRGCVTNK